MDETTPSSGKAAMRIKCEWIHVRKACVNCKALDNYETLFIRYVFIAFY